METLHVLVTDRDAGLRLGVARTLRDFRAWVPDADDEVGFTIEEAADANAALETIRRRAPDILLLDLTLSAGDALAELEREAGGTAGMLTILLVPHESAGAAGARAGWEVLERPFTPAQLRALLQKAAARQMLARRARHLADEKRRVRFEFVRVLGHELKAPLNAVGGYLDLVRTRQLGGDLAAYDEILARSALRIDGMRRLIGDLLNLTRIESGRMERRITSVDLRGAAEAALDGQRPAALARGITLVLAPGDVPPLRADAGEIDMILNNLVSNAVKYNRDGGRVTVSLERDGERVRLVVADTGIGMSREALVRIFGEFVRIRSTETAHVEGSGLGLAIVKKLVQIDGGTITADSEPGVGTTFTALLAPAPDVRGGGIAP